MTYKTEQESFWAGTFGDEYVERNKSQTLLASNLAFWSRILTQYGPVQSALELGANIGMNLMALDLLFPGIHMEGAEINDAAGSEAPFAKKGRPCTYSGVISLNVFFDRGRDFES